ncbi:MAG: hypothetical protein A3G45_01305 [Candidatus Staskawiczbacteria bacterium RIFCSPLOWO2_12_FULL_37_15]|uniref:Uncharacterized protein n=1 Tax=Candidatus Staskawiczbacteria bacterium RIFCSPLOWO2_12_FULL_37_15 TaxID=1802218 RepID=A0A1G2IRA3_9BACT|nr:MAG: hypothetical protein A3G45_01305 [Candidatus Staskawiczbacteria bacterium RIFCSPLOWO2_12_FULL_37_15]
MIFGSQEVMAPLVEPGEFYRGKRVNIEVIKVATDQDTPLIVREALVGLVISTIFDYKQMGKKLGTPVGSRLSYVKEVVETLKVAGKTEVAQVLEAMNSGELALYNFNEDEFVIS